MPRTREPARALGISPHTGWAACVVVGGSPAKPEIVEKRRIEILGDAERFCFHRAAEMKRSEVERWLASVRKQALSNAKRALAPLVKSGVVGCALVAKSTKVGPLDEILASHAMLHTAEGCFFRDVLRAAVPVPVTLVAPASLDADSVGKISKPPWGKDQKLAALAAWSLL